MPEGNQGGGGTQMDPAAVEQIGREFGHLAEALQAAAGYAVASPLTAEQFGELPVAARTGEQFMAAVTALGTSLGYVSQLATATEQALLSSAGLQDTTETTEAARYSSGSSPLGRPGGAI
ncbi:hypothetical protein [Actinokineospora bangkokensis]|uniref:Uncharacterized protein n=1 Tax=Actinokineospora bangkokensis TaxID=1193682 RepID=A0A1Q9LEY3_9PSEU|nr:hypothetical protein [Actinokineospora bangkokensis]OLR90597.1 hypothetical protein BJP25_28700 [Actinokineospora bangkokensis]